MQTAVRLIDHFAHWSVNCSACKRWKKGLLDDPRINGDVCRCFVCVTNDPKPGGAASNNVPTIKKETCEGVNGSDSEQWPHTGRVSPTARRAEGGHLSGENTPTLTLTPKTESPSQKQPAGVHTLSWSESSNTAIYKYSITSKTQVQKYIWKNA